MSDPSLAHDAELLARAVRGELAPGDDELRELFRRRPDWSEVLEELADGTHGGAPAELRALARANETESDREHMRALVERVAAATPGPRVRPLWRWAAAAVLVAAGWAIWTTTRPSAPVSPPVFLGDERLTDLDAHGLFEPPHRIAWKGKLGSQERYVVEILDATTSGAPARVVLQSPQLSEPAWMPSEDDVSALPRRVRVLVRVVGGMDEVSLHADVSR